MADESALGPYLRFTLGQRDRRWSAVRGPVERENVDVVVSRANARHGSDLPSNSRYLGHCGGGGDAEISMVLPLHGDITVIASSARLGWSTVRNWVSDVRGARWNPCAPK